MYATLQKNFDENASIYWANLSRTNNLIAALNISLFYVTQLVTHCGLYKSGYSLMCVTIVAILPLLPFGLIKQLWYYIIYLCLECIAAYFLVFSVWKWLEYNGTL